MSRYTRAESTLLGLAWIPTSVLRLTKQQANFSILYIRSSPSFLIPSFPLTLPNYLTACLSQFTRTSMVHFIIASPKNRTFPFFMEICFPIDKNQENTRATFGVSWKWLFYCNIYFRCGCVTCVSSCFVKPHMDFLHIFVIHYLTQERAQEYVQMPGNDYTMTRRRHAK